MLPDLLAGRYRILSPLGRGGMGEVFLAEDTRLERRVAVKLLPDSAEADAVARERLRREALAAAALDHPFICKVHEIGDADGRTFIVMEYVEGDTLQALARRDLLPLRQIVEIANELAQALEEAHLRGVVHRDLKPANVMVTKQGHVKVMDFGLAKQTPTGPAAGSGAATMLTGSGVRLGTPAYMSPEQVAGSPLDARSDIFSLGVILHELTTGAHPFMRANPSETMAAILRDPPSPGPRDAESLPGFRDVTNRMLAKPCAERFQTMSELRVELEALRDRVWLATSSAHASRASPAYAERTPFVGRAAETAELQRLLDRMLTGQGGLVLVGGEPGVGKTRLARELMREAQTRGCLCLTGHCYEMEGAPPFGPFIETTEQAVRTMPQAVRAAMGELAAEISVIVPSLRRAYPDIGPVPEVPAEQQRRLVFSAYLEYIRRAADKTPAVVLLDDLHWSDEPSLQLIAHVTPNLPSMRLLVVGTYRDVELDVNRPFAKTLETMLRQRLATRISVRRLNESGVQQMLSAMSGTVPPSGLATVVFRETEGNPFFVEEVYQHLTEEGKLFDEAGRWKENLRLDAMDVPEGVRLVIGRRLDRLGEGARKVLTAAAVIGRSFALDLLEAAVEASGDDVLEAVEEADRAQLVAAQTGLRDARYEFVHELIRATLVHGLSLPRRQRLHLKIADALERLRAGSLDSHASVLAHHLYQAGAAAGAQRTAKALALAGRRALESGAFEEALETFEQLIGLELAEDDPLVAEAFERRGRALVGLQRYEEAIAALDRALTLFAAGRDDAGLTRAATSLLFCHLARLTLSEAIVPLERALGALSRSAEAERPVLQALLAPVRVVASTGSPVDQFDEAWRAMNEATAAAERLTDPAVLGRVLNPRIVLHFFCLELNAAIETGRRSLGLLRPEALWDRANAMSQTARAYVWSGRFAEAAALLSDLERVASRAGHHAALVAGEALQRSIELMRTGNLRAFHASVGDALAATASAFGHLGPQIDLYLGQVDQALERFNASTAGPRLPPNRGTGEANLFLGNALAGRLEHARALLPAVVPWLPARGRWNVAGAWSALEAAVAGLALIGDTARCAALYPETLAYIDTGYVCGGLALGPGTPQLAAAIAADAAGRGDKAREHVEVAARLARDLPHRILQPMVQYWHGRMLSGHVDPVEQSRGRQMLDAAALDFRSLEMVVHADLAEQFLRNGG